MSSPPVFATDEVKKQFAALQRGINKLAVEMGMPLLVFFGDNIEMPLGHVCSMPCPNDYRDMWRAEKMLESLSYTHPAMATMLNMVRYERDNAARVEHRRVCKTPPPQEVAEAP
jgi:hypothetical protein